MWRQKLTVLLFPEFLPTTRVNLPSQLLGFICHIVGLYPVRMDSDQQIYVLLSVFCSGSNNVAQGLNNGLIYIVTGLEAIWKPFYYPKAWDLSLWTPLMKFTVLCREENQQKYSRCVDCLPFRAQLDSSSKQLNPQWSLSDSLIAKKKLN